MLKLFKSIFLTTIVTSTFASYSQTNINVKTLLDSTSLSKKQIVILFESDTLIILTTDKLFIDVNRKLISENNLNEDKELLTLFLKDSSNMVFVEKIAKTEGYKSRLNFLIAGLLESGECLVYNKYKKRLEKITTREQYRDIGVSGRKFKTSDRILIFETVDVIY